MSDKYNSTTEMEISNGNKISWLNTKDKILNSIKERQPSLYINALKVLDQIEREHNLSGTNQSMELLYYNNVSGFLHAANRSLNPFAKSSADIDRWPDSSMFVLKIQNQVVLIGLGGVIEYDIGDIKKYSNNNDYYVDNAKITFFNGSQISKATVHGKNGTANSSFFSNPSFNNDDVEILPPLGEGHINNSYNEFKNNLSFDFTNINYKENGENKTGRYGSDYTIKFPKGSSKLDLSLMSELNDAEIYTREKENGKYKLTKLYTGTTSSLVPDGKGEINIPSINGNDYTVSVIADGNNINSFAGINNEQSEAKMIEDYASLITNLNYDNQQKADKIDNFCKFVSLLRTDFKSIKSPFIMANSSNKIFGTTYKEQVQVDENGRFCFIFSNESDNTADNVQEVIFDDGSVFIGKCAKNDQGELNFLAGTFFKDGKKKKITDLTMKQLLGTTIDKKSEKITDKDLELFKNTKKLKIVKKGNNYETLFISKSLTSAIENGKLNQDYKPSQEYLDSLLSSSKDFCILMLYELSSGDNEFKTFAEDIKNNHFSEKLKDKIIQHIIELYNAAKDKGFENKNNHGDKITFDDITNLYNGIENLSYLVNIYEMIYNKPPYIKNTSELTEELNQSKIQNTLLSNELEKQRQQSNSVIGNLNNKVKELTESQAKLQQQQSEIAKPQNNINNDNKQPFTNNNTSRNSNFNILNSTGQNNSLRQSISDINLPAPLTYKELQENTLQLYNSLPTAQNNNDIKQSLNVMYNTIVNNNEKQLDYMKETLANIKQKLEPISIEDARQISSLFNDTLQESGITSGISPTIDNKFHILSSLTSSIKVDPTLKVNKISGETLNSVLQGLTQIQREMAAKNGNLEETLDNCIENEQIKQSQILERNSLIDNDNNIQQEPANLFAQSAQLPILKREERVIPVYRNPQQSLQDKMISISQSKHQPVLETDKDGMLYAAPRKQENINNNNKSLLNLEGIPVHSTIFLDSPAK